MMKALAISLLQAPSPSSAVETAVAQIPLTIWMWLAAVVLQTAFFSILGTWWISRLVQGLRDEAAADKREMTQKLAGLENDFRTSLLSMDRIWSERLDNVQKTSGAENAELLENLHSFEMWSRDHFVKEDSFKSVIDDTRQLFRDFVKGLNERLDRMERKQDNV